MDVPGVRRVLATAGEMTMAGGRLLLLGIDGMPPDVVRRFVGEGILPACAKLIADSAWIDVIPTLPALTAPGWMTIASGAHPGSLGISNILLPTPGEAPDRIRNGFDRSISRGQYLWEALTSQGRPAIVLKYPGSWPSAGDQPGLTQVDGAGGYADITCRFEEVSSLVYLAGIAQPEHTSAGCCSVPRGYAEHWRIDSAQESGFVTVHARQPLGWSELPHGFEPGFEAVLPVRPAGQRRREVLHALAGTSGGDPLLLVGTVRNGAGAIRLEPGQWSSWLTGSSGRGHYAYRLKLLELDPEAGKLRVYRSEGHRTAGFTVPKAAAAPLLATAGPVVEWTGTFDYMNGLIDLDTQLEIYDQHTAWLERAIVHLASTRPWDAFFAHWHVIEYAHHIAGSALDQVHPRHAVRQAEYLDFLRETYRMLDRLVATASEVTDPSDGFVVLGDHGHDLVHSLFYVNDFLRDAGWLTTTEAGGAHVIDWSRTRAYGLFPGLILLNRGDRWPGGVVPADQAEPLLADIASALRALVDPRTGRPVVTAVLGRTELAGCGQFGPSAPDLFFTMDRGYEPATRIRAERAPLFEVTEPGRELTSGHGSFHPLSASAATVALLRHPSFPAGSRIRYPVPMVDLAPTFAALLRISPPSPCDGNALTPSRFERPGVSAS